MKKEFEKNEARVKKGLVVAVVALLVVVAVASQVTGSSDSPWLEHAMKMWKGSQETVGSDAARSQRVCVRAGPTITAGSYGYLRVPQGGLIDGVVLTHASGLWESWTNGRGWVPSWNSKWGIGNFHFLMGMEDSAGQTVYPVNGVDGVTVKKYTNGKPEYYVKRGTNPSESTLVMKFGSRRAVRAGEQFKFGNLRMMTGHTTITSWHRNTVCFDVFILYSRPAEPVTCVYAGADGGLRFSSYGSMRVESARTINGVRLTHVAGKWERLSHGQWGADANWGIANGVVLMGMTDSRNEAVFPPATAQNGVTPYGVVGGVAQYYTMVNPLVPVLTMTFPSRHAYSGEEFRFWNLRMLQYVRFPHQVNPQIMGWHRGTVCFRVEFLAPPPPHCNRCTSESDCRSRQGCVWDTYLDYHGICRECHWENGHPGHCS